MAPVLLLGGTSDARALATLLVEGGVEVVSSLAGRVREPLLPPGQIRIGGFGGVDGLREYLRDNDIRLVVDATHPFATQMSWHAHEACAAESVPLIGVRRPPWEPTTGDDWRRVPTLAAAAELLPHVGRRALLTTGRQEVAAFADVPGVHLVIRAIDPPERLPAGAELVLARGPFTVEDELTLLREHVIDVLVTKNSGGTMTSAKLDAARALGLPVVMVDRAPYPPVPTAATARAAAALVSIALQG